MKLLTKITIIIVSMSLLAILGGGLFVYLTMERALEKQLTNYQETLTRRALAEIDYVMYQRFRETASFDPLVLASLLNRIDGKTYLYSNEGELVSTNRQNAYSGEVLQTSVKRLGLLGNNWTLVIEKPKAEIFAPAREAALKLTLFYVPVIAVILGIIYLGFIKLIARPIKALVKATQAVADGNLSIRAEVYSQDELGQLATSFNEMTSKLKAVEHTKEEFVSLASHQLRTPLTALRWYSEVLLKNMSGISRETRNYLIKIYTNTQRMSQLVNSLLNASRVELGTLSRVRKEVDLKLIAASVIDELNPEIQLKGLKFTKTFSIEPLIVFADPQVVRIIIQNLLSNAVKYTPKGGQVSLSIKKQESALLIIRDTGLGIPGEAQSKIFQKFFRADNIRDIDTNGSGLGLYIVKSAIAEVGGDIRFDSEEGKGTTFYVTLPLSKSI